MDNRHHKIHPEKPAFVRSASSTSTSTFRMDATEIPRSRRHSSKPYLESRVSSLSSTFIPPHLVNASDVEDNPLYYSVRLKANDKGQFPVYLQPVREDSEHESTVQMASEQIMEKVHQNRVKMAPIGGNREYDPAKHTTDGLSKSQASAAPSGTPQPDVLRMSLTEPQLDAHNTQPDNFIDYSYSSDLDNGEDLTPEVVAAYWLQIAKEGELSMHTDQPSKTKIRQEVERILMDTEAEFKDTLYQEVRYIITHFRERRCTNYCLEHKKINQIIERLGININVNSRKLCVCGLPKAYHTQRAIDNPVSKDSKWTAEQHTELLYPWTFGNMDIPGHYNYLEPPEGTRKYVRFDDLKTDPSYLWTLLIKYWKLKSPNLVISVTGGDVSSLYANTHLQESFMEGILKSAVTTKAWIITDGFHLGATREISDIFQEHLGRSQWAEYEDHANIPLIGIVPWGVIADRKNLHGIHVGIDEAIYLYTSIEEHSQSTMVPNALDPYHTIYLIPDDGTHGRYANEPRTRLALEKYIRKQTSLKLVGSEDVKTPVVILVLGGDHFTLEKLADATSERNQISVVIVNHSGQVAHMLATIYHKLEKDRPRNFATTDQSRDGRYGWSDQEEESLLSMLPQFESEGLIRTTKDKENLFKIMKSRHLIEVFGRGERDTRDLDKAILEAIFGGTGDIAVQLTLTLAMNRIDIAKNSIFVESRKAELKDVSDALQEIMIVAMETGRSKFVDLLLDQDYGGDLDFKKLLTVKRLHRLHTANLDPSSVMGKVLLTMAKRENDGSYLLARHQLLPQVGRIIYKLMGDNFRLLYQEKEYRAVADEPIPYHLTQHSREEPVWHLFIWAILANRKEMSEVFLFETSCKIGAALIAYDLFSEMSRRATNLSESKLAEQLSSNAEYFQSLAIEVLENLYAFNRDEAYAAITAVIPFRWSKYATPLNIADDAGAMRFMGHSCCQTLLLRIWYQYMDLDTKTWKLFPLFVFFPVNLAGIIFDKKNLNYGTFQSNINNKKHQLRNSVYRNKAISESDKDKEEAAADNLRFVDKEMDDGQEEGQPSCGDNAWFRIKNYYTSPVNKFMLYFVTWLVAIGIFSHFLITELRPVKQASEISVYEWIVHVWALCVTIDELKQLFFTKCSGPLYNLHWKDLEPGWGETWYFHERMFFVLKFYKFTNWIEDNWNKVDLVVLICFWTSVICRFSIKPADFTIVRILFAVTLIIFYYRILRIGYIIEAIGPRVITIQAMFKDLFNFILILAIFIISFGVAFEAILSPNIPASWNTLVDILWRPYWQMFGELFIDDATTDMGRTAYGAVECTFNRTLAEDNPEQHPFCYHWMAPILLGIFMLITNILLLNLLIAIFSHSFEKIQSEAQIIWRYHLYDLVHEYYHQVWLPPPFNVLCHFCNLVIWLFKWPRKWAYQMAKNRHRAILISEQKTQSLLAHGPEVEFFNTMMNKDVEERMKSDCCYRFYYNADEEEYSEEITHFRQPEGLRNEDLEEKAYKRYLRTTLLEKERGVHKLLYQQQDKLTQISADIKDFRERNTGRGPLVLADSAGTRAQPHSGYQPEFSSLEKRISGLEHKLDKLLRYNRKHQTLQSNISGTSEA